MANTKETATELQKRIALIQSNIGAIKKKKEQGGPTYAFRSIDDVMNKLSPLLAEHEVTITSEVKSFTLNHREYEKAGYGGAAPQKKFAFYASVHLAVTFRHGAETETWEEVAMSEDNSDKALTQAMSMAYKYAILRKFCILTEDIAASDSDRKPNQEQPTPPAPMAQQGIMPTLIKGSESYDKVVKALTQALATVEQVESKYVVDAAMKAELETIVQKAQAARVGGGK